LKPFESVLVAWPLRVILMCHELHFAIDYAVINFNMKLDQLAINYSSSDCVIYGQLVEFHIEIDDRVVDREV
jgi:hypothetical protein